jgi:amino acid transporter
LTPNYSTLKNGDGDPLVWPPTASLAWLFLLGPLLPAYTLTGYDASAHTAEETRDAARNVPRGIVRSVLVSGVFGWGMACAVVLAAPDLDAAARRGYEAFAAIVDGVLPGATATTPYTGIVAAQYLCGLPTVTSASRMAFAFARDRGLPFASQLRRVNPVFSTPVAATWAVSLLAVCFTVYALVYSTISAVCTVFLYISYVLPPALGLWTCRRSWTQMGSWDLAAWHRPLALVSVLGCALLFVIAVQPPNEKTLLVIGGSVAALAAAWFAFERRRFPGPPAASPMIRGARPRTPAGASAKPPRTWPPGPAA